MSVFLRLLEEEDKASSLKSTCASAREGQEDIRLFDTEPRSFVTIPGAPFAYWANPKTREAFARNSPLESSERSASFGLSTKSDFRFLRLWWEKDDPKNNCWVPFVKGGAFSRFYADPYLLIDWEDNGQRLKAFADHRTKEIFGTSSWSRWINNWDKYFRPGLTWPRRTNGLSVRAMPSGCIFADKGPAIFVAEDSPVELLSILALANSRAFYQLVSLQLARTELAQSYEVGLIQRTPVPDLTPDSEARLAKLAHRAWSLKRTLDTTEESSHAFVLPSILRQRAGEFDPPAIEAKLADIQAEIDDIAFDLYGFSEADRASAAEDEKGQAEPGNTGAEEFSLDTPETRTELLSWAIGVIFGRFDWRLATGEREPPPEPEPFDPLPAKSPGMLPDGDEPFHAHDGILVDDRGHPHDLPRLIDDVLTRVEVEVPAKLRRWLRKDFFPHHLKQYSKSRRKAPIYWPLSIASGDYTLWIYYPTLTSQTLYTAVNDFVDPKLKEVAAELARLRQKGADRSSTDEDRFAELGDFEAELQDLRTTLLEIAERYRPNQDDGVQITAAPLWSLFRHKPWQKVLKDTCEKLEAGDYDWAHLAKAYWPQRVVRAAHADRSIAIAHDLEDELWHEVQAEDKRGKVKPEWQPRELSDDDLDQIAQRFQ